MVRNAEKAKTPVMCVVGEKERDEGRTSDTFTDEWGWKACGIALWA